jgi:hypothetical protein
MQGRQYTWSQGETLRELLERSDEIKVKHAAAMERAAGQRRNLPLVSVLEGVLGEDGDDDSCAICHI